MTDDYSKFSTFTKNNGGFITFGNNTKSKIIGIGDISNSSPSIIDNVYLVVILSIICFALVDYVIKTIVLFLSLANA